MYAAATEGCIVLFDQYSRSGDRHIHPLASREDEEISSQISSKTNQITPLEPEKVILKYLNYKDRYPQNYKHNSVFSGRICAWNVEYLANVNMKYCDQAKPVGVSKDNGACGGLLEVNDQLYECLTKHFKVL